jgi:hypothetical protein
MTQQALLSRLSILGMAKETTMGTYVSPTVFIPALKLGPEDVPSWEEDNSIENSVGKVVGVYQTVLDSKYALENYMYWEAVGHFLVAAGWKDSDKTATRVVADGATTSASAVVTSASAAFKIGDVGSPISGTGIPAATTIISVQSATSVTMSANATASATGVSITLGVSGTTRHGFKLTSGATDSYSLTDWNVYEGRGYPGMVLDTLDLTIDAKSAIKMASSFVGYPSAVQTKPSPVYGEIAPGLGYQPKYSFAGAAANTRVLSATLSLKRNAETIHVSNASQNPSESFSADAEAALKLKMLFVDDTERNFFLNNTQPSGLITMTSPVGTPTPSLVISAGQMAWKEGPIDRSGKYVTQDFDITLVDNSTDGGGPCCFALANGVSAAY